MSSTDLYAKAAALETLATDVESCVDVAKAVADSPEWECSNATDVRGSLGVWRTAAQTAAANLRGEASRVRGEARRAADREEDAREASRRNNIPL